MWLDANVNFDLERLPVGERGWAAFLDWVKTTDDRAERHFLEFKSTIDLNAKPDRIKVVRFILGASNRDPAKAAKYFDGRALMVLGLAEGGAGEPGGVAGFEMSELEADVMKFAGADGPAWDVHRIPLTNGRDVIVIIVEPPTGTIYPVLNESVGIVGGDILLRVDGATRKASGPEIQQMLNRRVDAEHQLDVDVRVHARVLVVRVDRAAIREYADRLAEELRASLPEPSTEIERRFAIVTDARSRWQFTSAVDSFHAAAQDMPERALFEAAGARGASVLVEVENNNETFLNGLRVDLAFEQGVVAVPWRDMQETQLDVFPDRPLPWGEHPIPLVPDVSLGHLPTQDGYVRIEREAPAAISLMLNELRPRYGGRSDENDVVLVMFVEKKREIPTSVSGSWKLTAAGFHELLEGTFTLPVDVVDWRGAGTR